MTDNPWKLNFCQNIFSSNLSHQKNVTETQLSSSSVVSVIHWFEYQYYVLTTDNNFIHFNRSYWEYQNFIIRSTKKCASEGIFILPNESDSYWCCSATSLNFIEPFQHVAIAFAVLLICVSQIVITSHTNVNTHTICLNM